MNTTDLENKVKQAVHSFVYEKGFASSIDLLMKLEILSKQDYEAWRFGKVQYLERVCQINLSKLSLINKNLRKTAQELKLEPSWTGYYKHGKGPKKKLIFSKSGDPKIEELYATHYVDKNRINELKASKEAAKLARLNKDGITSVKQDDIQP